MSTLLKLLGIWQLFENFGSFIADHWKKIALIMAMAIWGLYWLAKTAHNEKKAKIEKAAIKQGGFAQLSQEEDICLANSSNVINSPQEAVDNTVMIETASGHGSGYVILTNKGWAVITNCHVVRDAMEVDEYHQYVKVNILNQEEGEIGEVIRVNEERDVALVTFPNKSNLKSVKVGFKPPSVGDSVYVVGTPLESEWINTATEGIISAVNRNYEGLEYIQSDVTINGGNSGGPLFLKKNMEVVGMAVAKIEKGGSPTGINLFIPIKQALDAVNIY